MVARYLNGGVFDGGSSFLTWREASTAAAARTCGTKPTWYPLPFRQVIFFDEREQTTENPLCPSGDPTCDTEIGSVETQRWNVEEFDLPFDFGWAYFNMQHDRGDADLRGQRSPGLVGCRDGSRGSIRCRILRRGAGQRERSRLRRLG